MKKITRTVREYDVSLSIANYTNCAFETSTAKITIKDKPTSKAIDKAVKTLYGNVGYVVEDIEYKDCVYVMPLEEFITNATLKERVTINEEDEDE